MNKFEMDGYNPIYGTAKSGKSFLSFTDFIIEATESVAVAEPTPPKPAWQPETPSPEYDAELALGAFA